KPHEHWALQVNSRSRAFFALDSGLGRPRKRGLVVGWSRPAGCADSRDIAVRLVAAYESRFTRRRTGGSRGAGLLVGDAYGATHVARLDDFAEHELRDVRA